MNDDLNCVSSDYSDLISSFYDNISFEAIDSFEYSS